MVKVMSRFAAFAAVLITAGVSFAEEEQVLYWMVDGNAEVSLDDGVTTMSINDYFDTYKAQEGNSGLFAARIRVTGGDITEPTFLSLYYLDDQGNIQLEPGNIGVEFFDNAGYWGAGVPTGNQSPSGNYANHTPEYAFLVELGNISWDETSQTASWVETIADSINPLKYSDLVTAGYIHESFDLNPPAGQIWTHAQFNEVPEPSGGLLLLVGGGLLLLRRRKTDVT